jgi:predicted nucleic acid-binding protein
MLFVYWLEDHPQFAKRVGEIHGRMKQRGDELITSAFTFGEVLAGAYRAGAARAADDSRRLLQRVISQIVPFDLEVSERYAQIRGAQGVAPADAIHLACAAQVKTDLFLTNDKRLVGKFVAGIQFIATLDTQLL